MRRALRSHWREYLIEAAGLGFFMIAAGLYATALEFPSSPLHRALPWPMARRVLMGLLVGATVVAIVYSPWGRRSGAHVNPAVTVTFWRLGKVEPYDAAFYIAAQFVGGAAGVLLLAALLGAAFVAPPVHAIATSPGSSGEGAAFATELGMAYALMLLVLTSTNSKRLARRTGLLVGALVACYIALLSPISGMSLNPARSFASALAARQLTWLWIYFTAPPLGMLLAAETYCRGWGRPVICAKIDHPRDVPCPFRCGYRLSAGPESPPPAPPKQG
ncbi:MAG: aquaporin [Myxococcales bacterium]